MIGAMFNLALYIFAMLLQLALFLIQRFYIVNSALVGLLSFMLTYKHGWEKSTYWLIFLVIFIGSIAIQYASKIARIVYGIFTCLVAAFIGYECKVDASTSSRIVSVAIWVLIVGFLNVLSHMGIEVNKATISGK